jgi:hypothetical protein
MNTSVTRQSNNRMMAGFQNTDSSITGTLTETIIFNSSAITMGPNDVLGVKASLYSTGTNNTKTFKCYIGPTSNSLVGAVAIGQVQMSATQLSGGFTREIANKNSVSVNNVYPAATNAVADSTLQTAARTALNINFGVSQFLIFTAQLANTADVAGSDNIQYYINKP